MLLQFLGICYHSGMSNNNFADNIPNNLLSLRKQQHYTQKELAHKAGLNSNYYAKVERGNGVPSLKTLYRLAKALDVTVSEIVGY
ncbi:MAG: hypothetical protein QG658_650 [Patescibacteria group bacterium]|nr:hypothetical protein [Patescibacteria group bacterium]